MKHPHHLFTRGAHGLKALHSDNEMDLCARHHNEAHNLGRERFTERYNLQREVAIAQEAVKGWTLI